MTTTQIKSGPVFNPVTRKGRFSVSGFGIVKTWSAVDSAGAKFKHCAFVGVEYNPGMCNVEVVRRTERTF